jgi:hypothetical protein
VTNSGTAAGTVSLYAVDATTGQTGGLVYLSHSDARRDVGNWITLGLQQLTLTPGQSQMVPFQVAIPSIVRPGQHVGGIVAESKAIRRESASGTNSVHINVQNLTIVAVQVNLPGPPVEQLVATGIQFEGENHSQSLLLGLDNIGTVLLKPFGNLQVTDAQGHLLLNLPIKLDTFLPQTAINYPMYVKGSALGVGEYQAALTLRYGHTHLLHDTKAFTVTQQQLQRVFKPSTAPQAPGVWGNVLGTMPLWQVVLGGLLVASGIFFWGQKLYRLATVSRRRVSRKKG